MLAVKAGSDTAALCTILRITVPVPIKELVLLDLHCLGDKSLNIEMSLGTTYRVKENGEIQAT